MLTCGNVGKTYATERGPVVALRGIDLEIRRGEFAAIVGRSGSGKSSLMAMIGGLSRPSEGTVRIDDIDIWSLNDDGLTEFRSRRIGFVFQFASLLPTLRIIDNVALPTLLGGRTDADAAYRRGASVSPRSSMPTRQSSPPDSSGARPSPAPSSTSRPCCSPTSRHPISTSRPKRRSWRSSATSIATRG
jgi:ABC-type lipoprotein export system ATPase subunit